MLYKSFVLILIVQSIILFTASQETNTQLNIATLALQNNTNITSSNKTNNNEIATYFISIIPVICFGSTNLPIKKFDCGNGIFYNWVIACTLLISGVIVHIIRGLPPLFILPALGGLIGVSGQQLIPPIIQLLGIGMGVLTYSIVTLLVGWITSYIGLFGIPKPNLFEPILNYSGVAVCVISIMLFALTKPTVNKNRHDEEYNNKKLTDSEEKLLLSEQNEEDIKETINNISLEHPILSEIKINFYESKVMKRLTELTKRTYVKRAIGYTLAIMGGISYGTQFIPIYVMIAKSEENSNYSSNSLDYIFSFTIGAFCTQTIFIVAYSIISLNNPIVKGNLILPGIIGGVLLSIAIILWAYVSALLNPTIAYPLITVGSPAVSLFWGLCIFREIKGYKNYIALTIGGIFMIAGVILITLSNIKLDM